MVPETSNTAATVLRLFEDAVRAHVLPSRVRGDRGGENIKVAVYMVMRKGPGRGSFLWGRYAIRLLFSMLIAEWVYALQVRLETFESSEHGERAGPSASIDGALFSCG